MSEVWPDIPTRLAVPSVPRSGLFDSDGDATAWIPGMLGDTGKKWNLVLMHGGDLNRYKQKGGDAKRLIIHHLTYDAGVINPLWGKQSFIRRVEKIKQFGCDVVVAADFSSWADMPLPVQIHNTYRTAVVAKDFVLAGFKVIPVMYWSHPRLADFQILSYGEELPLVIVDMMHVGTKGASVNTELFWFGAERFCKLQSKAKVWLWSHSKRYVKQWNARIGRGLWVQSRVKMLNCLKKLKGRVKRNGLSVNTQKEEKTCQV